ncbi:MAG: chemotaxis protein CheR [Betaproteobacteria bacterium]|nr:chemotaxis protein CheR [Betaproteobacteria bacterium]
MADLKNQLPSFAPAQGNIREFPFSSTDFERVRKLIHQHAGISLSAAKQDMVYSRLARRLRATGIRNFTDYLNMLEKGKNPEWEHFINALTTNLTSFFREPHHFTILADHLRKIQGRSVKIWCCAASTGEEPYSIAITILETYTNPGQSVSIVASDLDTEVLSAAGKGVYAQDRASTLSQERVRRFFTKPERDDGSIAVKPELRRMISFQRLNLLDPTWTVRGPFDAIFCRNVMIYFDKETQHKILKRFAPLLAADGLLFVGHSENFLHASETFRSRGKTVYELASASRRPG